MTALRRLAAFVFAFVFTGGALAACPPHDKLGLPGSADLVLCKTAFVIGYDTQGRIPLWVSMRMDPGSISPVLPRLSDFSPDPAVPSLLQADDPDYRGTGYDRGHLAPAASVDFSRRALIESFYYTNVAPQHYRLNRYAWKALEKHIRKLVYRTRGPVFAVAGTYDDPQTPNRYLKNRVRIPDAFFYAIFAVRTRRATAFLMPNRPIPSGNWRQYRLTVDALEAKTGLDFFRKLKDEIEITAESWQGPVAVK